VVLVVLLLLGIAGLAILGNRVVDILSQVGNSV
jgi:hypothetical protein